MTQKNMSNNKNHDRTQNLEYIRDVEKPDTLTQNGVYNDNNTYTSDAASTDHSCLTPSFADPLDQSVDYLSNSDDESAAGSNGSGPFVASFLACHSPNKKIMYREHKEMMRALNDKWECELERTIRQSEELLYEQARVVEHDQGISADRHMKEALDEAKEKEKAALKMEAKLREEYRELKLRLDREIEHRKAREAKSRGILKNNETAFATKNAIQRYCLSELSNSLEKYSSSQGDIPKEEDTGKSGLREEIRAKVRKFHISTEEKAQKALQEQEKSLRKEGASQLEESRTRHSKEAEELTEVHKAKVEQLHIDAERDREKLISEMKQSFQESMSRKVQQKSGCLRF